MSYPPYGSGPGGNQPQPNNPYQSGFPPQGQPPQQQPANPYNSGPATPPSPYGGQPAYGGQSPYGGQPPYGGGQPPFGGGPGIPGGPGGPGGSDGPGGGGPRRSRKKLLITVGVVLVVLAGGGAVAMAVGSGNAVHTSAAGGSSWSPPSWATKQNDIGAADPKTKVQGTVWLAKKDPNSLAEYAESVATPGSPDYHKYLTPAQFASQFTNAPDASSAVAGWVQQAGMTIVSQDDQSIVVSTTLGEVENILKVQVDKYKHDGRVDIAPTTQPQYPSDVGQYVASVTGLTTSSPVFGGFPDKAAPAPKKKGKVVAASPGKYAPASASGFSTQYCSVYWGQKHWNDAPPGPGGSLPMENCGYTPDQLRHAYGVAQSGLTGKGVTVAVVDAYASPTIVQDLARYNQEMGLPQFAPGQFSQVAPNGGFNLDTNPSDVQEWAGEESMDIEAIHTMAPAAKIVYYGTPSSSDSDFDTALEAIVAKHTADIVSCSWGSPEAGSAEEEFQARTQIFEQGAAEGIGFNFSAGDNGDYTVPARGSSDPNDVQPSPAVDFPTSDPFVTSVGGTSLGIGANGNYLWESGWGDVSHTLAGSSWGSTPGFGGGGGGGNSKIFPQPVYQKGVVPDSLTTTATGTANREVPDISMDGDGYTGILEGETLNGTISVDPNASGSGATFSESGGQYTYYQDGGTSLAAPLFSGVEALAQQAAGGVAVGFANPVLYKLNGTSALHDIQGPPARLGYEPAQETWDQSQTPVMIQMDADTSLKATPGYDDITGKGSPAPGFLTWFKDHPNG
ncbi:S53 family peptidase [Streptacidiphilus fuscans]|uniref:S8 family serine peptidase n=1 Tax=Streptacidiphilus fuscans TaxID=2789292 RepID=A0A931FFU6_9ACTN|nr:protease pro-enzyme activation domain-containing protein [Streptacidiphilus fuscans]MBF9073232.1 S8 family serine peptidase [Streptacidiphilus fuscans]